MSLLLLLFGQNNSEDSRNKRLIFTHLFCSTSDPKFDIFTLRSFYELNKKIVRQKVLTTPFMDVLTVSKIATRGLQIRDRF